MSENHDQHNRELEELCNTDEGIKEWQLLKNNLLENKNCCSKFNTEIFDRRVKAF